MIQNKNKNKLFIFYLSFKLLSCCIIIVLENFIIKLHGDCSSIG